MVYFNGAIEPLADTVRLVHFQVFDGTFSSNVLTGVVNITLVDDNPLTLDCGAGVVSFTEGSGSPVSLTGFLTLSDLDTDHTVSAASVAIVNAQEGDEILVDSSLATSISVQSSSAARIELVGGGTVIEYQVRIRL